MGPRSRFFVTSVKDGILQVEDEMHEAARNLDFERAIELRNQIQLLRKRLNSKK